LIEKQKAAITAIKQARSAPVQEPLFWYKPHPNGMFNGPIHNAQLGDILRGSEEWVPLYATTPAAQRQWVGLTDEEIGKACGFAEYTTDSTRFALKAISRAIEAKLKAKNG